MAMEDATGEFDPYADDLESAVASAGGSVSAVTSAVYGVLASASNLPAADFDVLAGLGSIAISSAYEWNGMYSGGVFEECTAPECTEWEMSVFGRPRAIPLVVGVGVAIDLLGAVAAARVSWLGGLRSALGLIESGGWGALASSGAYLLALM
jgi:hypothetical protein